MAFAMPAARSAPLVIDFLNVRGLSWGSCWVAATKNMGHRIRRRSVDLEAGRGVVRGIRRELVEWNLALMTVRVFLLIVVVGPAHGCFAYHAALLQFIERVIASRYKSSRSIVILLSEQAGLQPPPQRKGEHGPLLDSHISPLDYTPVFFFLTHPKTRRYSQTTRRFRRGQPL